MTPPKKPKRPPTLSDQLARYYELLTMALTRAPQRSRSVKFSVAKMGDLKGRVVMDEFKIDQDEGEDFPAYKGRVKKELSAMLTVADELNAEVIERQLAATLERNGGDKP